MKNALLFQTKYTTNAINVTKKMLWNVNLCTPTKESRSIIHTIGKSAKIYCHLIFGKNANKKIRGIIAWTIGSIKMLFFRGFKRFAKVYIVKIIL